MGQLKKGFFMSKMYRIVQDDKDDVLTLMSFIVGMGCVAIIFGLFAL